MWEESLGDTSDNQKQTQQSHAPWPNIKNQQVPTFEDKENRNPNISASLQANTVKPPIDEKKFLHQATPEAMAALSSQQVMATRVQQAPVDPQRVQAFVPEIFAYLRQQEPSQLPQGDFMAIQVQLSERMREILIDWLVDVAVQFHLATETLYLSILYLDYFLSQRQVPRAKFQLLGVSCLFLASKYEEIYPPPMDDYLAVADGAFTKEELLHYESEVIIVLDFRLVRSTPLRFLLRFVTILGLNSRPTMLARFLLELTLLNSKFSAIRPSHLAAGAAYLAKKLVNPSTSAHGDEWPPMAASECNLSLSEVRIVAKEIYMLLIEQQKQGIPVDGSPAPLTAIKRKYSTEKYMRASQILVEHRFN